MPGESDGDLYLFSCPWAMHDLLFDAVCSLSLSLITLTNQKELVMVMRSVVEEPPSGCLWGWAETFALTLHTHTPPLE